MKQRKLLSLIGRMVELSVDESLIPNEERIRAVICVLKETYEDVQLKRLLLNYLKELEKLIENSTLKIEHRGKLSSAAIEEVRLHFEKFLGRKLRMSSEGSPSLIAGIRISVADLVMEYSIAGTLEAYKKSIRVR